MREAQRHTSLVSPPLSATTAQVAAVVRQLSTPSELRAAQSVLDRLWASAIDPTPMPLPVLKALSHAGAFVAGGFAGKDLVGAAVGFAGSIAGEPVLHSHIVGVVPTRQSQGMGLALKLAQRAWAAEHGLSAVTWTFDPLLRRNAHFNMHKLRAQGVAYYRDFYGEMHDAINAGDRSDRLLVRWSVEPEQDLSAGREPDTFVLEDAAGLPRVRELSSDPADSVLVETPSDAAGLRSTDPRAHARWRLSMRKALESCLAAGYIVCDVNSTGAYILRRRSPTPTGVATPKDGANA